MQPEAQAVGTNGETDKPQSLKDIVLSEFGTISPT
jgi:hypothetical protein